MFSWAPCSFFFFFFFNRQGEGFGLLDVSVETPGTVNQLNYKTKLCWQFSQKYYIQLATDNFFRVVSLNLFFTIQTNLIKNNAFHNHIFIYYRNNHKCNTGTIINHKYKFEQFYLYLLQKQSYHRAPLMRWSFYKYKCL